jgi:hypothetical protein
MAVDRPVGQRYDVRVVKGTAGRAFNPSGSNRDPVALGVQLSP